MSDDLYVPEYRLVPLDLIDADPENPNVQDLGTFNDLVEAMKTDGWVEAMTLIEEGERYRLVAGEHRFKAGRQAGFAAGPGMIVSKERWDSDARQVAMIRSNMLRGKAHPEKFTALWLKLQGRYGPEALQKMIGLGGRDAELRRLIRDTTRNLPETMQEDLKKRSTRIRSFEDLASVVQSLFSQHGSTIEAHYVSFAWGGRTHLMIRASDRAFGAIKAFVEDAAERGEMADEALAELVAGKVMEEAK